MLSMPNTRRYSESNDGEVLRGELPRTAARLVREWIDLHREELIENWERAQEPAALLPIDPLD